MTFNKRRFAKRTLDFIIAFLLTSLLFALCRLADMSLQSMVFGLILLKLFEETKSDNEVY